jgi:arylsulfatase A-like enzyme
VSEESGDRRKFLIDALAVAAATPAAIGAATAQASDRTRARGRQAASGKLRRPNILFILTDEERYPPPYETGALRQWRETQLPGRALIRKHGLELNRHYIASAACVPSRASLFTGQYPSLHGTSQTDGAAKGAFGPDMFWLDPNTVPTLGHYFRAAGYKTFYKGKWHASESDILIPGTKTPLASYDAAGFPDRALEQKYLQADRLDAFGFNGYIGPTPHGSDARNSGSSALTGPSGRDVAYADQVIGLLDELERGSDTPWLTVLGLVNPHDIVLRGALSTLGQQFNFSVDPTVPNVPPAPTADEQLLPTKPICHASYKNTYQEAFQPTFGVEDFRRFYYQLHKNVDAQILRVMQRLQASRFYEDTIVVFTSDHGELLGAHGGLYQKWHNAYEEVVRVPCVIHNPRLFREAQQSHEVTSHIDLVPTLIGLAGLDQDQLRRTLTPTHTEAQPLVGRDLSRMVTGEAAWPRQGEPAFFMTDDEPTSGSNQQNFTGFAYNSVIQPNHVETIVVRLDGAGGGKLWKYSRYFDSPQFWTTPGVSDVTRAEIGKPGATCDQELLRTQPAPEQREMYDLETDPLETRNLAFEGHKTIASQAIQALLERLLDEQRARKRLVAKSAG